MKAINWLKAHIVEDVKDAWKWGSVRVLGIIVLIGPAWISMPDDLKAHMPAEALPLVSGLAFLGLLLRVKK